MRLIGDIHGKIFPYLNLLEDASESIQIGDFGMGFLTPSQTPLINEVHSTGAHRFYRGNHDDPAVCRKSPGWIEDGFFDAERGMMVVGGAWSIDGDYRRERDARTGQVSWWPDEEISRQEFFRIHNEYAENKPKIMLTHDCPPEVAKKLFFDTDYRTMLSPQVPTRTSDALQDMFYVHKPDLWVFGHWHIPAITEIDGTTFICLGELEYLDI